MPTGRKLAYDMDTALVDEQWDKLKGFLKPKLSDDDMGVVEDIARNGGDAPEPVAGRDPDGAADQARAEVFAVAKSARQARKIGAIDEAEERRRISAAGRPQQLDPKQFPNAGRLKTGW